MHVKFEVRFGALAYNGQKFCCHVTLATSISGAAQKYFILTVKGKLCSKFGEDRSKTGRTILALVAGWTDGRHSKVNLYSAAASRGFLAQDGFFVLQFVTGSPAVTARERMNYEVKTV